MHRRCWQRGSTPTDRAASGLPGASAGHVGACIGMNGKNREYFMRYRAKRYIPCKSLHPGANHREQAAWLPGLAVYWSLPSG